MEYIQRMGNLLAELFTNREMALTTVISLVLSLIGGTITHYAIGKAGATFIRANLSGKDLCKRDKKIIPESMGMISGAIFLIVMFLFITIRFSPHLLSGSDFPYQSFCQHLTCLLSMTWMLFLGFADDVFDLRWRYKLLLPTIASVPLVMVHSVMFASTTIVMPIQLRSIFGHHPDIGVLYYIYMSLLAVFCTNAINIYAGVNGLECGQSIVMAASIALFNMLEITVNNNSAHHLSLCLLIPFIGTTFALFLHNRYPADVFVGDTFTYFAGMTFAVVGILGHFSKTVMLFFLPQLLNFVYSLPQLFHFIPCPRHRLPQYNESEDKLEFSRVIVRVSSIHPFVLRVMKLLSYFRVLSLTENLSHPKFDGDHTVSFNNMTLINLVLVWIGPLREDSLTYILLLIQLMSSCIAFVIRYPLASLFYD